MIQSKFRCFPVVLLSALLCANGAIAQNQMPTSRSAIPINQQGVRAYAKIEVAFDWPDFKGDPFDYTSHDVRVRIAAPGGELVSLPAFFDGGNTWRARHTPKTTGTYRVVGVFDNGQKLALAAQPQRFKVDKTSALASAWVRVDAKNARRFATSDGRRFYPFGLNQAWIGGEQKSYEAKFTDLQNAGLNWSRIWMNHWDSKNLDWPQSGQLPLGEVDLKVARTWDNIIQSADRHNVYVQMTMQHHGQYSLKVNPNWGENPWNVKNGGFLNSPNEFFTSERARELTKRKLRYIVARYGYSPHVMAWELWNEVQFSAAGQDKEWDAVAAWHREMTDFLRGQDIYDHLVTTSSDVPPPVFAPVDYYQYHAYPVNLIPVLSQEHFAGKEWPVKPEFVGEFGPDNTKDRPDQWTMHSGLWAGLMSDVAGAAQYWEGDRIERDHYYFHFAAASALLKQSDFARQDQRQMVRRVNATFDTPDRTDLKMGFSGGWEALVRSDFDLSKPDDVAEFGKLSSYFQGENHRDMNPKPLQIKLNSPQPTTLILTLKQVAKAGANLRVTSNGATENYPFAATENDTKLDKKIAIPVAAGPQTVTLENTGQDWIVFDNLSVPNAAPILSGYAKANDNWMIGWFYNRDNIEAATPQGSSTGTALISPMKAGNYRVMWWDTLAGKPLQTVTARADKSGLKLQIPPVTRDIAVWAQKMN